MTVKLMALIATLSITGSAAMAEDYLWKPDPQQAAAVGSNCQGWRQKARGIYMRKTSGHPKPSASSDLEAKVIDEIYSPTTPIASQEMAESMGEQFCIPVMKEKFHTGALRVNN